MDQDKIEKAKGILKKNETETIEKAIELVIAKNACLREKQEIIKKSLPAQKE